MERLIISIIDRAAKVYVHYADTEEKGKNSSIRLKT